MIELYPDQAEWVNGIRDAMTRHRRVLGVLPTGGGKTVCFSFLARRASERGASVTILVHRDELVTQVSDTLRRFEVPHGIQAAGYPESNHLVQVASVFSLPRRIPRLVVPKLIIADEAHHCSTGSTWDKVITAWSSARLLGVTATPTRLDGKGLGDAFGEMVIGPSVADLIAWRRLSPYRIFAPGNAQVFHKRGGDFAKDEMAAALDKPSVTGDAVEHYRRLIHQQPSIAFCVSLEHASHVTEAFQAGGYVATMVDGKMARDDRRRVMADFKAGRIHVLVTCDLISEGFDVPGAMGGILLRPTQSLGLYMQQVGRLLRFEEGKTAVILDHAGNSLRHGLPDDVRDWQLTGEAVKEKSKNEVAIKQCPQCWHVVRPMVMTCPECGHVWVPKPREIVQRAGELVEVQPTAKADHVKQASARDIQALVSLGYSHARAARIMEARAAKRALIEEVFSIVNGRGWQRKFQFMAGFALGEVRRMKPRELKDLLEQLKSHTEESESESENEGV